MATIDYQAEALEQLDRDVCLKQRKPELPHTGFCHNCEEPTPGAYCSPECREDGEKRARFNRGA
jgi:hypothetical protein